MSPKKVEALVDEWMAGDESVRTRVQHEMRGSTNMNVLISAISKRVPAQAQAPVALLKTA